MAKYIVEAPEPKKGQKVSSGGIRENGKLASQFKNKLDTGYCLGHTGISENAACYRNGRSLWRGGRILDSVYHIILPANCGADSGNSQCDYIDCNVLGSGGSHWE